MKTAELQFRRENKLSAIVSAVLIYN